MRIFSLGNKAKAGFWCAAPDEDTAKDIALLARHAKNRQALTVTDVTEHFLQHSPEHHDMASIEAILNGTKTGRVLATCALLSMEDVLSGKKADKTKWFIHDV